MRVLLHGRHDLRKKPGGDAVHIDMLARLLPTFGVQAEVVTAASPHMEKVDLVHLFNLSRADETHAQWRNARRHGVPAVCTPIYSPRKRLERYELDGWHGCYRVLPRLVPDFERRQELKSLVRCFSEGRPGLWLRQRSMGYHTQQLAVLRGVEKILVDTQSEAEALAADFGLEDLPITIVPLGVDAVPQGKPPEAPDLTSQIPQAAYVLNPARVEPLKNQLALMRALDDTHLHVVFTGHLSRQHLSYARRFRAAVRSNPRWHYLGNVRQEQLAVLYDSAAAVAIPSWVENCCLAAVEGAMHDRPVVVTSESYTHEYLGNRAFYCDPASPESIRRTVLAAVEQGARSRPPSVELPNWGNHVRGMVEVYRKCLATSP